MDNQRYLKLVTTTLSTLSLCSIILALATQNWSDNIFFFSVSIPVYIYRLFTEEKMKNRNRTIMFGQNSQPEYLVKKTKSGLFSICSTKRKFLSCQNGFLKVGLVTAGLTKFSCSYIDYFPSTPYSPNENDSTNTIPCKCHYPLHTMHFTNFIHISDAAITSSTYFLLSLLLTMTG